MPLSSRKIGYKDPSSLRIHRRDRGGGGRRDRGRRGGRLRRTKGWWGKRLVMIRWELHEIDLNNVSVTGTGLLTLSVADILKCCLDKGGKRINGDSR